MKLKDGMVDDRVFRSGYNLKNFSIKESGKLESKICFCTIGIVFF